METVSPIGRLRPLLAFLLLVALGLLTLGCTTSSSPEDASTAAGPVTPDAEVATLAAQYQGKGPPGYLHSLPIEEANVGPQVGKYVPEFSLGLLDGSTITATSQVNQGRPTFLFFWATN